MSDAYQATYDAVACRIGRPDIQSAAESAMREAFGMVGHHLQCVAQEYSCAAQEATRPSAIYRPALAIDGNKWCALYGEDLVNGVAGFGDSPALAMTDFDTNWHAALPAARGSK